MAGPLLQSHDSSWSAARFRRLRAVGRALLRSARERGAFLAMMARRIRVRRPAAIEIGRGVLIGRDVVLDARAGRISLEEAVVLATGATLLTGDPQHGRSWGSRDSADAPISIGRGARIGADAILFGGARVGAGAIVGAGAVVRGHVEAGAIVVGGPPPRRIGERVESDGVLQFRGSLSDEPVAARTRRSEREPGPTLA